MTLYVAYSTDDNYAQHTGVSIASLLENNEEFDDIVIYVLGNNLSMDNKSNLSIISGNFNRKIVFIKIAELLNKLPLHINNSIALSAYARLFLASVVSPDVEKILYIDCDSIINKSLKELWQIDITSYCTAGVVDVTCPDSKEKIGINESDIYINSGVVLLNLKKWRENEIEKKLIDFIKKYDGKVFHHDQGALNGVLYNYCKIIHPKYNTLSVFFTMSKDQIIQYFNMNSYFYSAQELKEAIMTPVIIHYTPGFVGRPWMKKCNHPLKNIYIEYLKNTPWRNRELLEDNRQIKIKLLCWMYYNLPFRLFCVLNKIANKWKRNK